MAEDNSSFNLSTDSYKFSVPTTFTKPDVKFHWIEDGHLETILKVDPSWPQVFFGASFSYILAEFRNIIALFENQREGGYSLSEMIFFGVFLIACSISIFTAIQCWRSISNNKKTLNEIRSRKAIPL